MRTNYVLALATELSVYQTDGDGVGILLFRLGLCFGLGCSRLCFVLGKDSRLLRVNNQANESDQSKYFFHQNWKSSRLRVVRFAGKENEFQKRCHAAVVGILQDNGCDAIDQKSQADG